MHAMFRENRKAIEMTEATEKSKALVPFNKLNAGISEMRKQYLKVPDVKTKEGYAIVKENMKEYRGVKKRVEDTYKIAVEDINKTKDSLLVEKRRLIGIVEEVFEPHQTARKEEDERLAEIKREKAEAKAKRDREIQDRINEMRETYAAAVSKDSSQIKALIKEHGDLEITEELFGDDVEVAQAIKSAMAGKLVSLYESKRQQEEESDRIKKGSEELAKKQEAQKLEDAKRDSKLREEAEADRKRMTEENAKLKADNAALQAERKKLDEEKEKIEAEKQQIKDDKRIAKEKEEEAKREQADTMAKIRRDTEEAKEKAKLEAQEKKDREAAEKKAKKEAKIRRSELEDALHGFMGGNSEEFIPLVENKEIPYLRIDWTQK